jgi:lysophospholipase L1-like esterase
MRVRRQGAAGGHARLQRPTVAPRRPRRFVWGAALAVLVLVFAPLSQLKLSYVVGGINYVALGDSRAAGPAALRWLNDGWCARTASSYPQLLAKELDVADFTNASCSGAIVANILDTPQKTGGPLQPPQIDAVNRQTNLITISIGGNDVRWYNIARKCYTRSPAGDARCRDNEELRAHADWTLERLRPRLDALFRALRKKAPRAEIFIASHGGVVGYRGCWPIVPMSYWDARWVREYFDRMNEVIRDAAMSGGANYVDITTPSEGHDACKPRGVKWYEGQVTTSSAAAMHPNDDGMRAFTEIFLTEINADGKFRRSTTTNRD